MSHKPKYGTNIRLLLQRYSIQSYRSKGATPDSNDMCELHTVKTHTLLQVCRQVATSLFASCQQVCSQVVNKSVRKLSTSLFASCQQVCSQVVNKSVRKLSTSLFASCQQVCSQVVNKSVRKLSTSLFASCQQVCSQVVNKLCSHCLFLVCCNKFGTSC